MGKIKKAVKKVIAKVKETRVRGSKKTKSNTIKRNGYYLEIVLTIENIVGSIGSYVVSGTGERVVVVKDENSKGDSKDEIIKRDGYSIKISKGLATMGEQNAKKTLNIFNVDFADEKIIITK